MSYEQKFLVALFLTLIVEVPLVLFFVRYIYKHKNIGISNIIFIGILASALTLPYLWFVLPTFISNQVAYQIIGEFLVILIEASIYYKLLKLKTAEALLVSLVANIASVVLGLLL